MLQELRFAIRMLIKRPVFTATMERATSSLGGVFVRSDHHPDARERPKSLHCLDLHDTGGLAQVIFPPYLV